MRPDVKLGIVVSTVFVTVAGTYFLIQDRRESAIPVSSDPATLASTGDKTPPNAAKPKPARTTRPGSQRAAAPSTRPASSGVQNPSARTASRRNSTAAPLGSQSISATPTRDRRASRSENSIADTGTGRRSTTLAQGNRSRGGREPQRKEARRRQPKPQLALTATPATGVNTAIERHRVQAGDTIASLARQYYGSAQFAEFLISRNKHLADPTRLRVGEIVNIVPRPTDGKPSAVGPATTATREYRVKSGDSFYRIARDVLGDATRWNELFLMNKKLVGNDPTKLQIGQVIALPPK